MNKISQTLGSLFCVALLSAGVSVAFAQAPAAPATPAAPAVAPAKAAASAAAPVAADAKPANASKAAAKPAKTFAPQTAKSKECSMKADAQKLHGKARHKFRADCKKAA